MRARPAPPVIRAASAAALLALGACGGDDAAAPDAAPPTGPMAVEARHYDFAFDLATRQARATVTLRVVTGGDCVTLPLRAELTGGVTLGGEPARSVDVDVEAERLTACGAGWPAGADVELTAEVRVPLATWGVTQVGYSVATDVNNRPHYYLVAWVGGCDRFAPCDHRPDAFARYRFTVAHPAGTRVFCPGVVTAGDTETVCAFDHDGGPTYSTFGIIASPGWTTIEAGTWNGLAVTIHNRTGSVVAERIDGAWQAGFLAFMEARFGPYPYGDELRLITAPTHWNGFEHPGSIVLRDRITSGYADPVNHTLAHELAHQWAGDQTTLASTHDFVWKEAMAEYLPFVYTDQTRPEQARRTPIVWKGYAVGARYHPVPDERPPLLDYYGDAYGPGPMVLFRQLEALFSRDQVLAALEAVLGRPRALSVTDLRLALEAATGADLSGYFARWVTGAGAPRWLLVDVTTADAGDGAIDVTVTQVPGDAGLAGCAFAVELQGAGEGERHEVWFDFGVDGAPVLTARATPGFAVTATELDPRATCLVFPASAAAAPLRPRGWSPWVGAP